MKKIIFLFFIIFVVFLLNFNSKKIEASTIYDNYETTNKIKYSSNDVAIYYDDFKNQSFKTSSDVIDYVYEIGYNRDEDKIEIFGEKLTKKELHLFIHNPLKISFIIQCRKMAREKTIELYGVDVDDSIGNAFKHAYWTLILCDKVGSDFGYKLVQAHEEFEENETLSKNMDLFNDNIAYEFYLSNKTPYLLAHYYAQKLVNDGKLKYIIRNYSYLYKIVCNNNTHKSTSYYKTGDFFCYTNSSTPLNVPGYTIETVGKKDGFSTINEVYYE